MAISGFFQENLSAEPVPDESSLVGRVVFYTGALLSIGLFLAHLALWRQPDVTVVRLLPNAVGMVAMLMVAILAHKGRVRLAGELLVWSIAIIHSVGQWKSGVIFPHSLFLFPLVIMLSAWVCSVTSSIILGLGLVVYFVAYYVVQPTGLPQAPATSPLVVLVAIEGLMILIGALSLLMHWSYAQQLRRVRENSEALAHAGTELKKLSQLVEQSPESVLILDHEMLIQYANATYLKHFAYSLDEVKGRHARILHGDAASAELLQAMWVNLHVGMPWRGELWMKAKDGSTTQMAMLVAPILEVNGQPSHYSVVASDVSLRKQAEEQVQRLLNFDSLTQLPNRNYLHHRITEMLADPALGTDSCALLILNIDRFNKVNAALGHDSGDALLAQVGQRLQHTVGVDVRLARLSADEFAIVLVNRALSDASKMAWQVLEMRLRLQEALAQPFDIKEEASIHLTASLGAALFPTRHGEDSWSAIIRRADTALHRAKDAGGGQLAFFDEAMGAQAESRYSIESELHQALAGNELRMFLQAKMNAQGQCVGAESLVRWQHPSRGLLGPSLFIPVAEETGLICDLGDWMLRQACELIAQQARLGRRLCLAVNVSPRQFRRADFVARLTDLVTQTQLRPGTLTLEITEGLLIDDVDAVIQKMGAIVALGVLFSIDDFGTGYSSLAYLKRLPICELKIDKSFIQNAPFIRADAGLVESIMAIANNMGLKLVAEGVETQAHADYLIEHPEVILQGFLFSRPECVEDWLKRWIQEWKKPGTSDPQAAFISAG